METDVFSVNEFIARTDRNSSSWVEIDINGVKTGIEFRLVNLESDKAAVADENYRRRLGMIPSALSKDDRFEAERAAVICRLSELIVDVRGKNNKSLILNGKEFTLKDVRGFLMESPSVVNSLAGFLSKKDASCHKDREQLEKAVRQYFFLNQQYRIKEKEIKSPPSRTRRSTTRKKNQEPKFKRNIDDKIKFIKLFGKEEFERLCEADETYAKYKDIPFPDGTSWLFGHFIEIWHACEVDFDGKKVFTPKTINDYCSCFGIDMTIIERRLLMLMRAWAADEISKLKSAKNNVSD